MREPGNPGNQETLIGISELFRIISTFCEFASTIIFNTFGSGKLVTSGSLDDRELGGSTGAYAQERSDGGSVVSVV